MNPLQERKDDLYETSENEFCDIRTVKDYILEDECDDFVEAADCNTHIPKAKYDSIFDGVEIPSHVEIRNYQKEAVYCWRNNGYIGVFNMATGTGKTITALLAMQNLKLHCNNRLGVIILCPYKHLVNQWVQELKSFLFNPIIGYSGRNRENFSRYLESSVRQFNKRELDSFIFITTNNTFRSYDIQYFLSRVQGKLLLISDEAHSLGSMENIQYLTENYDYRLGLSATFERYWDEEGSRQLRSFFGKDVFSFSLRDAIKGKFLVPYEYHPVICYLSEQEYEKYLQISLELKNHIGYQGGASELTEYGKLLLIQRARLVSAANDKINQLDEIIKDYIYAYGILIYCGAADMFGTDEKQIDHVTNMLRQKYNMSVAKFTCEESMDERKRLLQEICDHDVQALAAIRCLDEGVNIPNVETAFILASANNPKEYIQRRGRVLRCAPGKEKAVIFDFVTLPYRKHKPPSEALVSGSKYDIALVMRELKRMKEFGKIAMNRNEVNHKINEIQYLFGLEEKDGRA